MNIPTMPDIPTPPDPLSMEALRSIPQEELDRIEAGTHKIQTDLEVARGKWCKFWCPFWEEKKRRENEAVMRAELTPKIRAELESEMKTSNH